MRFDSVRPILEFDMGTHVGELHVCIVQIRRQLLFRVILQTD